MDGLKLLKQDHQSVEDLFKKYEGTTDRAHKTRRRLVNSMIQELSVHAAIEEQVLYPMSRERVKAVEDHVLESLEEHHIVKWTLSELDRLDPTDERFDAKVRVLMESVRHHVEEEEHDLFPQIRKAMSAGELAEMGERLARAREAAPTKPHPRAPDTPPGNLVAGPAAAVIDAGRDAVRGVVDAVRGRGEKPPRRRRSA